MQTIQMTLDERLVAQVDEAAKKQGTTRVAFTQQALKQALTRMRESEMEQRHRQGYERYPVDTEEFGDWEDEQVWIE